MCNGDEHARMMCAKLSIPFGDSTGMAVSRVAVLRDCPPYSEETFSEIDCYQNTKQIVAFPNEISTIAGFKIRPK